MPPDNTHPSKQGNFEGGGARSCEHWIKLYVRTEPARAQTGSALSAVRDIQMRVSAVTWRRDTPPPSARTPLLPSFLSSRSRRSAAEGSQVGQLRLKPMDSSQVA